MDPSIFDDFRWKFVRHLWLLEIAFRQIDKLYTSFFRSWDRPLLNQNSNTDCIQKDHYEKTINTKCRNKTKKKRRTNEITYLKEEYKKLIVGLASESYTFRGNSKIPRMEFHWEINFTGKIQYTHCLTANGSYEWQQQQHQQYEYNGKERRNKI